MPPATLACPACHTPLPPEDLSQSQGITFCRRCQTLIRLDTHRPETQRHLVAFGTSRTQVALPAGWMIEPTAQGLRLTYRWFSQTSLVLALFCLLWGGCLVVWYNQATKLASGTSGVLPLINIGIGLCVWLFLVYVTLASFLNTTTITVEQGSLTVVHAPLFWPRPPRLRTTDIAQLFVRRVMVGRRHSRRPVYSVWAQLRRGQEIKLLNGLEAPDQALFVEQQLEAFLGIPDRPVPGEMER